MSNDLSEWIIGFDDEVQFILASVIRCGAGLRKRNHQEHENPLSDRLLGLLKRDPQLRDSGLTLNREYRITDEAGGEVGRLDFWFLSRSSRGNEPYFAIEAKRLHFTEPSGDWSGGIAQYVGAASPKKGKRKPSGMMCFVAEKYSRGQGSAGMLGYVLDGDVGRARIAIAEMIQSRSKRLTRRPPCDLVASAIAGVDESRHSLARGSLIIYHVLLAV
ncbi:MAG: hypothetical protein QM820_17125 [Minicystis sp.]